MKSSQPLRCTPRNVTDLVDALEAAGLVTRGPHPTDRRATLVSLTKQGEATAARMQVDYQQLAAALFPDLSRAELTAFVAILDQTLGRLREAVSRYQGERQRAAIQRRDGPDWRPARRDP